MKKKIVLGYIFLLLNIGFAFAQPGGGGEPEGEGGAPAGVPIDGGLGILIAAGGVYVASKMGLFSKKKIGN